MTPAVPTGGLIGTATDLGRFVLAFPSPGGLPPRLVAVADIPLIRTCAIEWTETQGVLAEGEG
ncbi:MAG: hypothetical protein JRM74_02030 [Nitrososphaerota archaeon]|nr:hypothetical protein [Nitrososphaerota archaeon]MDG6959234.1 hypothetical protein [Nitrososphaerota archaeon]MDG6969083.1 hypothetical protein [Nitrososphaerota archaeon]MDG6972036.1 hypothetical protein [Nitrososphaerota archaeon]MDG6976253.1 hypothetical protein [Nitrososphaerota archaeon]